MNDTWDVERKEGKDFTSMEVPPDGAIPARICAMIDIGTHDARDMKGNPYERRCLFLGYELGENDSTGKPFYMSEIVTLSMDTKATLYSYVKSIHGEIAIGEKLKPGWLAGKPCLLQITHDTKVKKGKERTYANIESVGKPPKGTVTPSGGCVVWRIQDWATTPLPNLDHLPPKWNETLGKMLTVAEWVTHAKELTANEPTQAADLRMPPQAMEGVNRSRKPAQAVTQEEADKIPF